MSLRHNLLTERLTSKSSANYRRVSRGLSRGPSRSEFRVQSSEFEAKFTRFRNRSKFKLPDLDIDHHPILSADHRQFTSAGEHFFPQVSQDETLAFKPR